MTAILRVPYLGTAEEDVLLSEWFVGEGDSFRKGEAVAVVETLKATFEVEAEADGVLLRRIVEEGARVALQAPLAVIGAAGAEADDAAIERLIAEAQAEADVEEPAAGRLDASSPSARRASAGGAQQVAPVARRIAKERGIDLAAVRGTGPDGLVRAEDVEAFAAGGAITSSDGTLDPAFVANVKRDRAAFGALDSEFKLQLYRQHGAIIGSDAHLAAGATLCVDRLVLGSGAFFGANTHVEARTLIAGDLLHFGRDCSVRCTRIECGDNAFFTDDIEIGGGGALDPEAELVVGSHGFVGEHVHLNPCRRLEIGDEVVISRSAVVMTHSFGGSILGGYPNRFAGVRIGSYSQVGIQATLFPGVEVGEGSILLSGSSLVSSIPAGRLFGGVPAVDMKAAAQPADEQGLANLAFDLVREFARQLELRGRSVELTNSDATCAVQVDEQGQRHLLVCSTTLPGDVDGKFAEEVRVVTSVSDADWSSAPVDVVWIDLSVPRIQGPDGPLAAAFREFLRKRGVRLRPRAWTYRGGWL